jgi:catechol 2,3-dioxygenase-like lactoylglutathione lyase family enzyme
VIELGRLHHVSICVANLEATRSFYCDVLGMDEVERPPTFQFKGQWFRKNGYEIHTIYKDAAGQIPGDAENIIKPGRDITFARHFCFSVSSVDETIKTLAQNGIEFIAGPRPRGDGATQMYIYDPDGHMVELVYEPWDWPR